MLKSIIKRNLLLKTMFSKLLASFILVIAIVSLFFLYSDRVFVRIIEDEIARNINDRFDNDVRVFNRYLEQITTTFIQCTYEEPFYPVSSGKPLNPYDQVRIVKQFKDSIFSKSQNEYVDYLRAVFIVTEAEDDDIVVESRGTFTKYGFYNIFFNNKVYNEQFWRNEINREFSYKIYPESVFLDKSRISPGVSYLTPLAFRSATNNKYLIVALIDTRAIMKSDRLGSKDSMLIYDKSGELIYPIGMNINIAKADFDPDKGFAKIPEGYLFKRDNSPNRLVFYKLVSNKELRQKIAGINRTFYIALLLSVIISAIISIMIVIRFNNPVKEIVELIKSAQSSFRKEAATTDLGFIRDNIQKIVSDNVNYVKDITVKNSLLHEFFVQSRLKDIYLQIDEIKTQLTIAQKYVILLFKVHYREKFFEKISEEKSKATYFFKELIQVQVSRFFPGTITFQAESDQVVSVVNIDRQEKVLDEAIGELCANLSNEDIYAFFTIVVSRTYDDVSQIRNVYNRVFELVKHRKLIAGTQVIKEETFVITGSYNFPDQQRERFCSSLQNGQMEESLLIFDSVLDHNLKKEVDNFNVNLLCLDIMKCTEKVLNNLYSSIPQDINVSELYSSLEKSSTPDEYKKTMHEFISRVVNYISNNKKGKDYIIDYIKNYVNNNYEKDISLDILAQKLNLTNTYISAYFKEKTGVNLSDYINHFRIKKAIELMENTQLKIKDISVKVGMPNINTFIRAFKKYAGYTPKKFKSLKI